MKLLKTSENSHTVTSPGVIFRSVTLLRVSRLLKSCNLVPGNILKFSRCSKFSFDPRPNKNYVAGIMGIVIYERHDV
jgi:hypothetical protein